MSSAPPLRAERNLTHLSPAAICELISKLNHNQQEPRPGTKLLNAHAPHIITRSIYVNTGCLRRPGPWSLSGSKIRDGSGDFLLFRTNPAIPVALLASRPASIIRVDVFFLLLALAAGQTVAAQPGSAEPQTGASRVALASVTDARNRPLVDVGEDDFVIQEGGASREILSVRPSDYPIIVLVDTGDDPRGEFELMRKAVAQFINRIGQRPVALGTFGAQPLMLTTFDDDRQTVLAKLEELTAEAGAGSLLLQGAALAGETMKEHRVAVLGHRDRVGDAGGRQPRHDGGNGGAGRRQRRDRAHHRQSPRAGRRQSGSPPAAARPRRADARRVHDDLLGRILPVGPRPARRPDEQRDDDRVSGAGRVEAERREGRHPGVGARVRGASASRPK